MGRAQCDGSCLLRWPRWRQQIEEWQAPVLLRDDLERETSAFTPQKLKLLREKLSTPPDLHSRKPKTPSSLSIFSSYMSAHRRHERNQDGLGAQVLRADQLAPLLLAHALTGLRIACRPPAWDFGDASGEAGAMARVGGF